MGTAAHRIVLARFKKWVPEELWFNLGLEKAEKWAFIYIQCGNTFPAGHRCGFSLGIAEEVDPDDPLAPFFTGGETYVDPSGVAYAARSEQTAALGLRVTRRAGHPEVAAVVDEPEERAWVEQDEPQERAWVALHWEGYRWVKEDGYFDTLRPHKFGLRGRHTARRALPKPLAAKVEAALSRDNLLRPLGLSVERGVLGDTPWLPALIRCPRCSTPQRSVLNEVRPPTLE
jgi:hypothetical protein